MRIGLSLGIAASLALSAQAAAAACPGDDEIKAELVRLGAQDHARPEVAVVGDRMRVVLRGQDGSTLGNREVEAPASCHERAAVAAVLVATWMGIWNQIPAPAAASSSGASPTQTAPVMIAESSRKPPLVSSPSSLDIGLSVLGAYDGNSEALGIGAHAGRTLAGRLGGFIALSATTEREQGVGVATAGYTRPILALGLCLRLGQGRVVAEGGLSAQLGLLILRGKSGLATTRSATHVTPGVGAQLRVHLGGGSLAPFLVVAGSYRLSQQTLTLVGDSSQVDLPRWDLALGFGIGWAPGRRRQ